MKFRVIFIVALAICLSSSLALAATIHTTGDAVGTDLWTIVNNMASTSYTSGTLNALTQYSTITSGAYEVVSVASFAGYTQAGGFYDASTTPPGTGLVNTPPPSFSILPVALPFSQLSGNIAFYNTPDSYSGLISTDSLKTTASYGAGLILQIGTGDYIVAFEDGNSGSGSYEVLGDSDFNDLVLHVKAVPLPGAVLLLGAGMVRLAAYARRRKED
jgi:hypothetical protein